MCTKYFWTQLRTQLDSNIYGPNFSGLHHHFQSSFILDQAQLDQLRCEVLSDWAINPITNVLLVCM